MIIVSLQQGTGFNVSLQGGTDTPIVHFFASTYLSTSSTTVELGWVVENATYVEIDNGVGQVDTVCGTTTVSVNQTTTYNIEAHNSDGITNDSLQIVISPFATVEDDGTTTKLSQGDSYTCTKDLQGWFYFEDGESDVTIDVNSFTAGTYTGVADSNNVGSLTYEVDSGSGFNTVSFNFSVSVGDRLKITRSTTSGTGYVYIEGEYT